MTDGALAGARPLDLGASGSWFHGHLRDTLHIVVSGLADSAGLGTATVTALGRDGHLDTLAVAGDDPADRDLPLLTPGAGNHVLMRLLHAAVDVGGVGLVALPPATSRADPSVVLVSPLVVHGAVVGALWATIRSGAATHSRVRERLTVFAGQAERTLRTALDSHLLAERARLTDVARRVVRAASAERDLDALLLRSETALLEGLQADRARIRTHASPDHAAVGEPSADVPPWVAARLVGLARSLWRDQRVALVTETDVPPDVPPSLHVTFTTLMRAVGISSVLVVPVGAGAECLGHVVIGRGSPTLRWTDDEARVALDIGHDLGGAVLTIRRSEQERQLVQRLQQLDAYKSRLIATVSHEIKNPLAAVRGHLELLEGAADLDLEHQGSRDAMVRSAQRLERVVDELLLLARVGEPPTSQRPQRVDLVALLTATRVAALPEADQRGIELHLGPSAAVVEVVGERDDLARVLSNLVANAVRFSPPGTTVTLTVRAEGEEAVVGFVDQGIGMTAEDRDRASTEFFRSSDPAVRAVDGAGLGLTIVDRVVAQHGGRVELESSLGGGTTVRVYLPVASTPADLTTP